MTKHTDPPWTSGRVVWLEEYDGGHRWVAIDGPDYNIALVQCDEDDAVQAANVALLTAAPKLLAVCQAIAADARLCRLHSAHQKQLLEAIAEAGGNEVES